MTTQDARSRILIVDDMETNIDILLKSLEAEYDVRVAMDGKTALQSVDEVMPDLILLDIMMPEMDGYEVCRRLKANKATQDIPIIFLTAVSMDASEHMGLSLGAIDYITKPFNFAIVKARVKNHVALRQSQLDVIRQRDELEIAYRKLQDLEKMRDDLERLIIHDMRSPLTSILGFLELVASEDRDGPGLDREECIRRAMDASQKLADMITALLDVSSLESGRLPLKCGNCDIRELADNVVNRLGGMADDLNVSVESSGVPVLAYCDPEIIRRVIQNLLGNALKFTPPGGNVRIEIVREEQWVRLSVIDNGPGIPREYHEKVFQKFGQVEMRKEGHPSTGLGLTFCKLAVEAHGGSIQLESEPGHGSLFHVRLPGVVQPAAAPNVATDAGRAEQESSANHAILREKIGILLVDDDRNFTDSFKRYLEQKTRWTVTVINHSEQAIRAAREQHHELIILDIDMPYLTGMDISEELKRIPGMDRSVIVFLTGLMRPEEAGKSGFRKKGDYPVIAKGLPMVRILDLLTGFLAGGKSE